MLELGARFYWPEIGRFISQDPIGDGNNWYAYVGNNPVVRADPRGLCVFLSFDPAVMAANANRQRAQEAENRRRIEHALDSLKKLGYKEEYDIAKRHGVRAGNWLQAVGAPFGGVAGWTNPVTGTITINPVDATHQAVLLSTIVHEVQHARDLDKLGFWGAVRNAKDYYPIEEQVINDYRDAVFQGAINEYQPGPTGGGNGSVGNGAGGACW